MVIDRARACGRSKSPLLAQRAREKWGTLLTMPHIESLREGDAVEVALDVAIGVGVDVARGACGEFLHLVEGWKQGSQFCYIGFRFHPSGRQGWETCAMFQRDCVHSSGFCRPVLAGKNERDVDVGTIARPGKVAKIADTDGCTVAEMVRDDCRRRVFVRRGYEGG